MFIQKIISRNQLASSVEPVAAVLGAGAGWEISLLKNLQFAWIVAYEPANPMLNEAKQLVGSQRLSGVDLYGVGELDDMTQKWGCRANFVLGTHVIPALENRPVLHEHLSKYHELLTNEGLGLAITNNPQDQFSNHFTYGCHHLGASVNDGDRIYTQLKDPTLRMRVEGTYQNQPNFADNRFIVEDTFWSDSSIRAAIRSANLILTALYYVQLAGRDDIVAPYVGYAFRKSVEK